MGFEGVDSVKFLLLRFIRNLLNTLFNALYSQKKVLIFNTFFVIFPVDNLLYYFFDFSICIFFQNSELYTW